MIKIIEDGQSAANAIQYPCIKRSRVSGRIVLFTNRCSGVCLCVGNDDGNSDGHFSQSWEESDFDVIKEPITLLNV